MATSSASKPRLDSEQAIIAEFKRLVQERETLSSAAIERRSEVAEHDLVIKTLEPLDVDRKCFRLVGEVMVESSVATALPEVKKNRENLQAVRLFAREAFDRLDRRRRGAASSERRGGGEGTPPDAAGLAGRGRRNASSYARLRPPSRTQLVDSYERQLAAKQKEVIEFQERYKIKVTVRREEGKRKGVGGD